MILPGGELSAIFTPGMKGLQMLRMACGLADSMANATMESQVHFTKSSKHVTGRTDLDPCGMPRLSHAKAVLST